MLLTTPNSYEKTILKELRSCKIVWSAIAYITEDGMEIFIDDLADIDVHLICNTELGSSSLKAIKNLLSRNDKAKVKIYNPKKGKFHPKLWIFGENDNKPKNVVIGSANLTYNAMKRNIEVGVAINNPEIAKQSYDYFWKLWRNDFASEVKLNSDLDDLISSALKREERRNRLYKVGEPGSINQLVEFIDDWIKMPKNLTIGPITIWRGWYIIPDQGEINDELIINLKNYLPLITGVVDISKDSADVNWKKILGIYESLIKDRARKKTSPRDLFVRSHKNYMNAFGWIEHVEKETGALDKGKIRITPTGERVRDAKSIDEVCDIYTEHFMNFTLFEIELIPFLIDLLGIVDRITFQEMEIFVNHAISKHDLNLMANLIEIYRGLDVQERESFHSIYDDYFDKYKEPTGKGVYTNYRKSVKYTLSAIAWCKQFDFDGQTIRLKQ